MTDTQADVDDTRADVAATGTGVRPRPRGVLPALCATQITSWGTVYYASPVPRAVMTTGSVIGTLLTLLQATAVTDRWGTTHYGRLSGLLGAPAHIAGAPAPWAGAALAGPVGATGESRTPSAQN